MNPEILRQVRLIELRTRNRVDSLFGGEYHSVFRGQGMEFLDVRDYQEGDDVRTIDWNVTARAARAHVRRYVEERELNVLLAVDYSASKRFATRDRFKAEMAAELAAVIALCAVRNNDRVGLLVFTDRIEHYVPPRKGRRHALRLIRDLLAFEPVGQGTDMRGALDFAGRLLRHRAVVFMLSDFLLPEPHAIHSADDASEAPRVADRRAADRLERALRVMARRHDLIAVRISDPAERELPPAGLLLVRDPETGREVAVDTSSPGIRALYRRQAAAEWQRLARTLRQSGADTIDIVTGEEYTRPLLTFFRKRERRVRR